MELGVFAELLRNLFKKPHTVRFPQEKIPIPEGYRGKHHYSIDKCTGCGLCERICPNRAIEMVKLPEKDGEDATKRYPKVDLGKCCFCGLCEDICPSGALKLSRNFYLSTFDSDSTVTDPLSLDRES